MSMKKSNIYIYIFSKSGNIDNAYHNLNKLIKKQTIISAK